MNIYEPLQFFTHLLDNGDVIEWSTEEPQKVLVSGKDGTRLPLTEAKAYNLIRGIEFREEKNRRHSRTRSQATAD